MARNPEQAEVFDEAMAAFTRQIAVAVAATYDFGGVTRVADIGGGNGALLLGILRAHPHLGGVVFDLPSTAAGARATIAAAGLAERCTAVGGDFFAAVPEGCDLYLLKHVIHDWDDERAVAILGTCRRAMAPAARLLIVEGLYPPRIERTDAGRGAAANDVNMLVCTGGRQRSDAEFSALYAAAGLRLARIIPTPANVCLIEAEPAAQ
jgi:SAM-dependent methyltransferase